MSPRDRILRTLRWLLSRAQALRRALPTLGLVLTGWAGLLALYVPLTEPGTPQRQVAETWMSTVDVRDVRPLYVLLVYAGLLWIVSSYRRARLRRDRWSTAALWCLAMSLCSVAMLYHSQPLWPGALSASDGILYARPGASEQAALTLLAALALCLGADALLPGSSARHAPTPAKPPPVPPDAVKG